MNSEVSMPKSSMFCAAPCAKRGASPRPKRALQARTGRREVIHNEPFCDPPQIQLQLLESHQQTGSFQFAGRWNRFRAKGLSPQLHHRPHRHVKNTPAALRDAQTRRKDLIKFATDSDSGFSGCVIHFRELTVAAKVAEQPIQFVHALKGKIRHLSRQFATPCVKNDTESRTQLEPGVLKALPGSGVCGELQLLVEG